VTAYNFKAQFADAVLLGAKRQTIRAPRKRGHAKVGDQIKLFTGMRTKGCRFLKEVRVSSASAIVIDDAGVTLYGRRLALAERERLAENDGFVDFESLVSFFRETHGLPFEGVLITW